MSPNPYPSNHNNKGSQTKKLRAPTSLKNTPKNKEELKDVVGFGSSKGSVPTSVAMPSSGEHENRQVSEVSKKQSPDSQRERISSLLDGSRGDQRPILRVNLIKKSNRQPPNLMMSLAIKRKVKQAANGISNNSSDPCETEPKKEVPKQILRPKRKIKDQKVEQQQQVKEKRRIEKNRDLDQKITAIKEAYNHGVQTLRKKINQKHEQSERRHEINLRLIRQKAFELSIKRYNSFKNQPKLKEKQISNEGKVKASALSQRTNRDKTVSDGRRLQLKPFTTKKLCSLCDETISSESALFSHLRSETHLAFINQHYGDALLTTNEAVEIHNLKHILETDEPLDNSDDQQSSRASSLVNHYHGSQLNQANGIYMSEVDHKSLAAIEKKCRKLRHELIVAGKPFNRDWFTSNIRRRLASLIIQQRSARNQTTSSDVSSLANTIDLSANNSICQHNKPFYLKMNRITRELISVTTDQRISGGGLMPAGIIHTVDRLLADLTKQLDSRKVPNLSKRLLSISNECDNRKSDCNDLDIDADELATATKMIESFAIDSLFLYDIITCLVSILRRIIPDVSLTSKLPLTIANHYSTLIDPISLNSYYCHRPPILPARVYIKMIRILQSICEKNSDLCYMVFQSNSLINLSDVLSYRLGFILSNESPASSISGSSSAATISANQLGACSNGRHSVSKSTNSDLTQSSKDENKASDGGTELSRTNDGQSGSISQANSDDIRSNKVKARSEVTGSSNIREDKDADFWENEAETYKRREDVADDMTASLCKLLATITETILNCPLVLLTQPDESAFDQRSNDFIR